MSNSAFAQDSNDVLDATYVTLGNEVPTFSNSFSLGSLTTGVLKSTVVGSVSTISIDASLTSLSAFPTGANKYLYSTGVNTWAEDDITALGRVILADPTPEDMAGTIFSGASIPSATVAAGDLILGQDIDDSGDIKVFTAQSIANLGGGGTVTSVSGTASRITSSGGATPAIDISASYVGQTSITTLGTITTGTWSGNLIAVSSGGTGASTAAGGRANLGLTIGADVQAFDATLQALSAYNTNGILTQTSADNFAARTMTGTANELTVTNGNGVSGNPTFSLPAALTFTGKTVTGGTIAGMTGTTFTHSTGSVGTAVTGVTQSPGDNSTKLATTAYVDATGGGTVTSVSGTISRITSTGGATPIIDIDAGYDGQTSINVVGTINTGVWNGTNIAIANGGTAASTEAQARTNLGLTIGSNVQAYDVALQSISGLTTAANNLIYTTASNTYAVINSSNSSILVTSGAGTPSLSTAIPDGVTATTQSASDNSTNVATTAYVDTAVSAGGSAGLTPLQTVSVTSGSEMVFDTGITSASNQYMIKIADLQPATDDVEVRLQFSTDGGSTWLAANYKMITRTTSSGTAATIYNNGTFLSYVTLTDTAANGKVGNHAVASWAGTINLFNPADTNYTMASLTGCTYTDKDFDIRGVESNFALTTGSDVDAVRIYFSSGNIATGKGTLYRLEEA